MRIIDLQHMDEELIPICIHWYQANECGYESSLRAEKC